MSEKTLFTGLEANDIGRYVIVPGDPKRADLIAKSFDNPVFIGETNEHRCFTGTISGERVSAVSTGMGGPSVCACIEELAGLGAHTFIRIGTSGRISDEAKDPAMGGCIVTAAVRDEATSGRYIPDGFPAVADPFVTEALLASAGSCKKKYLSGIVQSKDYYYGEQEPLISPDAARLTADVAMWKKAGVVCCEMESSTLFAVCREMGLRAGSVMSFMNMDETIGLVARAVAMLIGRGKGCR